MASATAPDLKHEKRLGRKQDKHTTLLPRILKPRVVGISKTDQKLIMTKKINKLVCDIIYNIYFKYILTYKQYVNINHIEVIF